jgi:hypothetical protein
MNLIVGVVIIVIAISSYIFIGMRFAQNQVPVVEVTDTFVSSEELSDLERLQQAPVMTAEEREIALEELSTIPVMTDEEYAEAVRRLQDM